MFPRITCIIPTLNEELYIGKLLAHLHSCYESSKVEFIVVDARSTDRTREIAQHYNVTLIDSANRSRAHQLNLGVRAARSEIYYFVHADTIPPLCCFESVIDQVSKGSQIGGFRFKFDSDRWILQFNSYLTRFNLKSFRGGDQTIFITKKHFEALGGFNEYYSVMEEYDLMKRSAMMGEKYTLVQKDVMVSARKYAENSWLRVNFANFVAMYRFNKGIAPDLIKKGYSAMLQHKIIGYQNHEKS
jgi:rSAM/selenodomain-associated transferase 2